MSKKIATPHLIPGTNILKNKKGISDREKLNQFERLKTSGRLVDVPSGDLSIDHLKKIHKHLLQDVYEWAGKFRDIPTERGADVFCRPEHLENYTQDVLKTVNISKYKELGIKEFSEELGELVGELNAAHPFLDGNGRTIRAYAQKVSEKAGYRLDISRMQGKEWNDASIIAFRADSKGLADILGKNLSPVSAVQVLRAKRERRLLTKGLTR